MIAVCGTGMGSLAGLLQRQGYIVVGSDANVYPPMSTELARLGIPVTSPFAAANLTLFAPDLVIVGNAISRQHVEAEEMLRLRLPFISMPEALNRFFLHDKEVIVVAGTHGKTTTTALMAYLLSELGEDPSYLIGGVPQNLAGSFHIGGGKYFVIEGDEYDTAFFDKGPKFLHYNPRHVIMTSLEFDHADIYKDIEQIVQSFCKLAALIPNNGSLHVCDEYPRLQDVIKLSQAEVIQYGANSVDFSVVEFQGEPHGSTFWLEQRGHRLIKITSPLAGYYNAQNVAACFSVLVKLGLDIETAARALPGFAGIKRRQEVLFDDGRVAVLDDFAHHPTAVAKTVEAIQQKYPERRLIAIFEPRSNTSRRKVFQKLFAKSFACAHRVIFSNVFLPDKVPDGEILDVAQLAADISAQGIPADLICGTDAIIAALLADVSQTGNKFVLLFMSNGGFDGIHQRFISAYKKSQ